MSVEFEWDERKRISNLAKQGVDFRNAVRLDLTRAVVREDRRRDYGELRLIAFALLGERLHVLVFTQRRDAVRIISLCRANDREFDDYEAQAAHTRGE